MPFICPFGGEPEGAVPFIIPPGGVPEGAVLFVCTPDGWVPDGAALFPPDCWVSVEDWVDDETALLLDWVELVPESCVHPAIMIPAIRIAEAISMSDVLFFMDTAPGLPG